MDDERRLVRSSCIWRLIFCASFELLRPSNLKVALRDNAI